MSSSAMYSKSSGMSRHTTLARARWGLKRVEIFARCERSMQKIVSAHSSNSGVTGLSESALVPAEEVSMPGQSAKTCSAVGLRSRFLPQMKRTLWDKLFAPCHLD